MKIVQAVGWYYPDSIGGTEIYVAELARQLSPAADKPKQMVGPAVCHNWTHAVQQISLTGCPEGTKPLVSHGPPRPRAKR